MASEQDIRPLPGQNFNTDDPELAKLRARLHLCRRELGRMRAVESVTPRVTTLIVGLKNRETMLIEKIANHEEKKS